MVLVGGVYVVVGVTFAALAGSASSNDGRVAWRLAAWLISAAAFAAHIWYEHSRMHCSPAATAVRAAVAVAVGAFALAAAATIRGQVSNSAHQGSRVLALVLWPIVTAAPAFVVALGSAAVLAIRRRVAEG